MKLLGINLRTIYYCLPGAVVSLTDAQGYETGERASSYSLAASLKANVAPPSGHSYVEMFGTFEDYDRIIVTDDMSCPIDENTVLFVDKAPAYDTNDRPLFDYVVRRVAKSLNYIAYAVKKVETA